MVSCADPGGGQGRSSLGGKPQDEATTERLLSTSVARLDTLLGEMKGLREQPWGRWKRRVQDGLGEVQTLLSRGTNTSAVAHQKDAVKSLLTCIKDRLAKLNAHKVDEAILRPDLFDRCVADLSTYQVWMRRMMEGAYSCPDPQILTP